MDNSAMTFIEFHSEKLYTDACTLRYICPLEVIYQNKRKIMIPKIYIYIYLDRKESNSIAVSMYINNSLLKTCLQR